MICVSCDKHLNMRLMLKEFPTTGRGAVFFRLIAAPAAGEARATDAEAHAVRLGDPASKLLQGSFCGLEV